MLETTDRAEAERAVLEELRRAGVPAKWREPIAAEVLPMLEEVDARKPSRGKGSLGLIVGRWVIRDDDLAWLDAIAPVVISISAASVAKTPAYATSAALGTIYAVLRFVRTLSRKGAVLPPGEVRVLAALKALPEGATAQELFKALRDDGVETLSELEESLARLKEVKTKAGLLALVSQDKSGRWVVNGV